MNLARQEITIMVLFMAVVTVCAVSPSRILQKRALDSEVIQQQCCLAYTVVFYAISYINNPKCINCHAVIKNTFFASREGIWIPFWTRALLLKKKLTIAEDSCGLFWGRSRISVNFDLFSRFPWNFNEYVSDKFSNIFKDFRRFSLVAEYFPKENPKTFAKYTNRIIIKRNSNGRLC